MSKMVEILGCWIDSSVITNLQIDKEEQNGTVFYYVKVVWPCGKSTWRHTGPKSETRDYAVLEMNEIAEKINNARS